jgi:hypothetical protein
MCIIIGSSYAATYYVAPNGKDAGAGTITAPFATWSQGQTAAAAGDTVYFREGTYALIKAATACGSQTSTVNVIALTKSGISGKLIHYFAYPGEKPVFDFSGVTSDCRIRGVAVTGSWIHIKGLEIKRVPQNNSLNHENWGILITGSNNIFEQLNIHHIMGAGLFIQGGEGNLVLNCDSHENYDPYTSNGAGESGDGFGCHTTSTGTVGNVFRGCRGWWNSDDGFDCITCKAPVVIENCWMWLNGYLPGTLTSIGNGNGFKLGGFGSPPSGYPATIPQHTARFCVSFLNKAAGFYQNHHPVSNYFYNNTSFNNKAGNFNLLGYNLTKKADASMGILRNNLAFTGTAVINGTTGTGVDAANNSWNLGVTIKNSDFMSIDTTGVYGPRKADGSLPDVKFMHLTEGSQLIDKGVSLGLPYSGSAPDLGAFEYINPTSTAIQSSFSQSLTGPKSPQIILVGVGGSNKNDVDYNRTAVYTIMGKRIYPTKSGNTLTGLPAGIYIENRPTAVGH